MSLTHTKETNLHLSEGFREACVVALLKHRPYTVRLFAQHYNHQRSFSLISTKNPHEMKNEQNQITFPRMFLTLKIRLTFQLKHLTFPPRVWMVSWNVSTFKFKGTGNLVIDCATANLESPLLTSENALSGFRSAGTDMIRNSCICANYAPETEPSKIFSPSGLKNPLKHD